MIELTQQSVLRSVCYVNNELCVVETVCCIVHTKMVMQMLEITEFRYKRISETAEDNNILFERHLNPERKYSSHFHYFRMCKIRVYDTCMMDMRYSYS